MSGSPNSVTSAPARGGVVPRRVAIFRALQLGDLLCAVPALRALRAGLPESELVLIGLPWARTLLDRYPAYLNGFREFPGWPGLPEQAPQGDRIPDFLAGMRAERFDLVLQLHGSGVITNPLAALLGARRTAGFYTPGNYRPDPELFLAYPDEGLEVRRLLRLLDFLGFPAQGEYLEFPVYNADHKRLSELIQSSCLEPGRYVCVHPGASVPERRWPAERFAAVAKAIAAGGLRVVLTGTGPEAELTAQVARGAGITCLDLAGRTDLGTLAALLNGARLLVCNDTGVSHLAAALRTPSVVVSTGDNPARWAPTDLHRHRVLGGHREVSPAEVVGQAEELLSAFPTPCRSQERGAGRTTREVGNAPLDPARNPERDLRVGSKG